MREKVLENVHLADRERVEGVITKEHEKGFMLTPQHANEIMIESRDLAIRILNLFARCGWVCKAPVRPGRVIPSKEPRYPLERRLGMPHGYGEEKISCPHVA